jgi:excinuclease ABC subunit A
MGRVEAKQSIRIKGAREHNLKGLDLDLPRNELVVITGVSGSGKSSLAFDTLYAEGYRKYIESLSSKARQLLDQIDRPNVDYIEGLSPVIAIEQRSGAGSNPRSTVATVTETADYARLIWALMGERFCPIDGSPIIQRTLDDCIETLLKEALDKRVILLAPTIKAKPAVLREEIPRLKQKGYQRIRLNGEIHDVDEPRLIPSGAIEYDLDIVIDRLVIRTDQRSRIADSLELAMQEGKNKAIALINESNGSWRELPLNQHLASQKTGIVYDKLTPKAFSWNHPEGACPKCGGTGRTQQFHDDLLIPDPSLSVKKGAIKPWRLGSKAMIIKRNAILKQLAEQLPFDPTTPWKDLTKEIQHAILHGVPGREFHFKLKAGNTKPVPMEFKGVIDDLKNSQANSSSDGLKARLMTYQVSQVCHECGGKRLSKISLSVFVEGLSFADFLSMSISDSLAWMQNKLLPNKRYSPISDAVHGLERRLHFLNEVGIGYLSLDRQYQTLSGGETQRVRLATQLGMGLVGVIYVLDEPSIGLHPDDNKRLIRILLELRDQGNTVIVVEHDGEIMQAADRIIELGPHAGARGGHLVFDGTPEACKHATNSQTGAYLSGQLRVEPGGDPIAADEDRLTIFNATENNLKDVTTSFPVGLMTVVAGISGSGKSTLVNDILANYVAFKLNKAKSIPGKHKKIEGLHHFERVIRIDQEPIGRSPRSNAATYTKLFDQLRDLYSRTPLAKVRGYKSSRFSFNTPGGRCERCKGDGLIKLDMQFLSDVYVECPSCHGQRYNRETLDIRFRGVTIAEALQMTVDEALELFSKQPRIAEKLSTLQAVGLGYLKIGQSATTLSGGEAQRVKLSLELSKRQMGRTLYLLDEPTTGLHWSDIQHLMDLLFKLRDQGNTIIIIEHNLDVIRLADWIVELGPTGGQKGGHLLFSGSLNAFRKDDKTPTQKCLSSYEASFQ